MRTLLPTQSETKLNIVDLKILYRMDAGNVVLVGNLNVRSLVQFQVSLFFY